VALAVVEAGVDRTRRRYSKLLECSDEVALVVSPDGETLNASESVARVFSYRPTEVGGETLGRYVHDEDLADALERFQVLLADATSIERLELRIQRADGETVTAGAWARNLVDDPNVGGAVVYLRDVPERAEREAWVRALIEHSTDVTSVIDHDGVIPGGPSANTSGFSPANGYDG
jgi:PAS domain S-box-containing protein